MARHILGYRTWKQWDRKQQGNMANHWEMTGQWDRKFIATLRHRRDVLGGHNKGLMGMIS